MQLFHSDFSLCRLNLSRFQRLRHRVSHEKFFIASVCFFKFSHIFSFPFHIEHTRLNYVRSLTNALSCDQDGESIGTRSAKKK